MVIGDRHLVETSGLAAPEAQLSQFAKSMQCMQCMQCMQHSRLSHCLEAQVDTPRPWHGPHGSQGSWMVAWVAWGGDGWRRAKGGCGTCGCRRGGSFLAGCCSFSQDNSLEMLETQDDECVDQITKSVDFSRPQHLTWWCSQCLPSKKSFGRPTEINERRKNLILYVHRFEHI